MTNEEYVKNLSTEDLSDYIIAVYKTGILVGRNKLTEKDTPFVNYKDWLKEERIEK